jgi:hypothetical protein
MYEVKHGITAGIGRGAGSVWTAALRQLGE